MEDIKMEAEIIFETHVTTALRRAERYAGEDGYIASMAQLLHARTNASYDNEIWNNWFTSNSEESIITTPQGNRVLVAVHGGGIFAKADRFDKLHYTSVCRTNPIGFTGKFAAKITVQEAHDVLEGKLPDGSQIPVYSYDEFKLGIADLPRRYAVVTDMDLARKSPSGYSTFDVLKDDPLMIVRAGGVDAAAAYLDKARDRHNTEMMGNFHPFETIDLDQPQTTIMFLGGNEGGIDTDIEDYADKGLESDCGIRTGLSMQAMSRYIAVAPRNVSTYVRNISFAA